LAQEHSERDDKRPMRGRTRDRRCHTCGLPLSADHVLLVTTAHLRRFCSVECVVEGHRQWMERLGRI